MDEKLKQEILRTIENHNKYVALMIRDQHDILINKIRSTVFVGTVMLESELRVDDPEEYEREYQEYLKSQVLKEAKKAHREKNDE